MKTRQDLIAATLQLLNAVGAGQNPEPEDVAVIDGLIDGKLAELSWREIFYANDPSEFDDEFVDPLAIILANAAAPSFGQARNAESQAAAESILRQMRNSTYVSGSVLPGEYF
jgi:hypothetical protein